MQSFPLKKQVKKRNEATQSKKDPYYKNIITEALHKKIKKIEKYVCSLFFPLFSYTLYNCMKKWTFYVILFHILSN